MDVFTAIKDRRSIRKYSDRIVEDDVLRKVLEAARLSPSARNLQPWKFVVVRNKDTITRLGEATGGQSFVGEAPVIICSCATETEGIMMCGQYRYTLDLSIATAYMILEAYEQGLGTCWLGRFDEKKVKEILGVPDEVRVVAMTTLGYPAETPPPRPRKDFDSVVCFEKYY
jgi:nitroreductase